MCCDFDEIDYDMDISTYPGLQQSKYVEGKWLVVETENCLATPLYDTPEEAVRAHINGIFTDATLSIQKEIKDIDDMDNDGCIALVTAIYDKARSDYFDEYKLAKKVGRPMDPITKDMIEDFFRGGYYTLGKPGEWAVKTLHKWTEDEYQRYLEYMNAVPEEKKELKRAKQREYDRHSRRKKYAG